MSSTSAREKPRKIYLLYLLLSKNLSLKGVGLPGSQNRTCQSHGGGRDFARASSTGNLFSKQPGSAFKPIIYAAALEKGYTLPRFSWILQSSIPTLMERRIGPKNYDKASWAITFRNALAHSRNVVTVKILEDIGSALYSNSSKGSDRIPIKRDLSIP